MAIALLQRMRKLGGSAAVERSAAAGASLTRSSEVGPHWPEQTQWAAAFLATDGSDGPTLAAGACVTQHSLSALPASRLQEALSQHSCFDLLAEVDPDAPCASASVSDSAEGSHTASQLSVRLPDEKGGFIFTGPTGTNVMDIAFLLIPRPL